VLLQVGATLALGLGAMVMRGIWEEIRALRRQTQRHARYLAAHHSAITELRLEAGLDPLGTPPDLES